MALSTQPYRGARDFYPEDKRVFDYIVSIWKKTCLSFGFEQYDAPILEPIELYSAKSGTELVNEQAYTFIDRGGRQIAIRPEMTPTVSRMVAGRRQQLVYPLRLFSIPNLWRYERPQRGRLREHWQLNADIFGIDNIPADHEIILLADTIMQNFGANRQSYIIRLNSRHLVNYILDDYLGLSEEESRVVVSLIDKMHKMPSEKFYGQLKELVKFTEQKNKQVFANLQAILSNKDISNLPRDIQEHSAVKKITELKQLLKLCGITNASFDISLMRGLDYYTDIVFEIYDTNPANNRSLFGGGRYDGLVGLFGVEPVSTVGFGMGDVALKDFLETHQLLPILSTQVDAVVIPIDVSYKDIQKPTMALRGLGVNVAIDPTDKKIVTKIRNTLKRGINYVVFIGQEELNTNKLKIKNLITSDELSGNIKEIANLLTKKHKTNK